MMRGRTAFQTAGAALELLREGRQARSIGQLALRNSELRSGSGGRQSVSGVVATVFGATGFLGRYVVSLIGEGGGRAVCPHRCDDLDMQHLRPMGDLGNIVTLENFSIRDEEFVKYSISKSNVVINLIGQNTETWNYGFKEVHEDWPRRLADMCADTPSVERLIHVSCLGADVASPSPRLATRGKGDEAVQEVFPNATIMRLAPLVGVEDRFFNDMALWIYANNGAPIVDGGSSKVQPVYVVDVAEAIHKSLQYDDAVGAMYELGGPETMQMRDLAYKLCDEMRENRKLHHVQSFVAAPIASFREWLSKSLPMHMMTRDLIYTRSNILEGSVDKVVSSTAKGFADLHVIPRKTTTGVAIDHVRHWRKGGYNVGTNEPDHV
eukprot:jgi/Ulvmu1/4781/UM020_0066.1